LLFEIEVASPHSAARNSAFAYKGRAIDLRQIGRDLNVRYALEGSVQRGGNRLRVNVQLIDCDTGSHLWAERFDQELADLSDMQDNIVARLASQLGAQLSRPRRGAPSGRPTRIRWISIPGLGPL
jgi:TolB-like protein